MSFDIAEKLEDEEQFERAYEEYKRIYENRTQSIEILERLAHLAMILDKKDEAVEYYSKILEKDATNTMAYEQLMDIYINTDKYKYYIYRGNLHVVNHQNSHAISDFKKALAQAQEEEQILSTRFVLANLYEQESLFNNAIDEYLKVIDSEKVNEVIYVKLAKLYEKMETISSAISILEGAIEKDIASDELKEYLAQLYLKNGQPNRAGQLSTDKLTKIRSLMDEGKEDEAFEILNNIEDSYKKNPKFYSLLAQYYYQKSDFDKALSEVDNFDNLEKNSPLTYQMRALIFEEKGDEFNSHLNWAKYYLLRKETDVALNEYMIAYHQNNKDVDVVATIANLLETMNDKTRANEFYEILYSLDSKNKKALLKLAEFRGALGDYRGQIQYLEALLQIDWRNLYGIIELAKAYEKTKNKLKALEMYKKYSELSSECSDDIKKKIAKLENSAQESVENSDGLIGWIMSKFGK